MMNVTGFNQFQNEILVIDTDLNDEFDAKDEFIAINLPGFRRGEKIPRDHPRLLELKEKYAAHLAEEA